MGTWRQQQQQQQQQQQSSKRAEPPGLKSETLAARSDDLAAPASSTSISDVTQPQPDRAIKAAILRHARFGSRPASADSVQPYVLKHLRVARSSDGHSFRTSLAGAPAGGGSAAQQMRAFAPAAAPAPAPAAPAEDADLAALLARNLVYELCVRGAPLNTQYTTIARLLHTLPLLSGLSDASVRSLAESVEVRRGERYGALYNYGVETGPRSGDGFAFVLLSGSAAASEEMLRARSERPSARVDSYVPGTLCGAEPIAAPPRVSARDPALPRTQSCIWTRSGVALAVPLASLAAAPIGPAARRPLEQALCTHLLAALLPDRDQRSPPLSGLAQLASGAVLRRARAGELLFLEGQAPSELVFLVRGRIELAQGGGPPGGTAHSAAPAGAAAAAGAGAAAGAAAAAPAGGDAGVEAGSAAAVAKGRAVHRRRDARDPSDLSVPTDPDELAAAAAATAAFAHGYAIRIEPGPVGADALLGESRHACSARVALASTGSGGGNGGGGRGRGGGGGGGRGGGGEASALLIRIPSAHARAVMYARPELRTMLSAHAMRGHEDDVHVSAASASGASASGASVGSAGPAHRPQTRGDALVAAMGSFKGPSAVPTGDDGPAALTSIYTLQPATAKAKYLPSWHRARAALAAKNAFADTAPVSWRSDGEKIVPWTILIATTMLGEASAEAEQQEPTGGSQRRGRPSPSASRSRSATNL